MYSGEAEAQMITRVVISGSVFIVKLAGKETLQLAKFLSAAVDGELSTSGQIKLKTLLKSGQPLKVFTLKGDDNFVKFAEGAAQYGIVYSVVKRTDEEKSDQVYDIMVKQSDAAKINRVIEKYGLMQLEESDGSAEMTRSYEAGDDSANGQDNEEMLIEDVRTLMAKMMEGGNAAGNDENFPVVSESEDLSGTQSEFSEDDIEPELFMRVPGTAPEERPSLKAEIKHLTEESPTNNTVGANPGLLAQMLVPEDAEEKDRLKYGMGIIEEAVMKVQNGGEVLNESSIS